MSSTRSRPPSVSSGSLMQDVPGSIPVRYSYDQQDPQDPSVAAASLSLSQAVHARRAEYVRPRHIRIKIGTWNVAAYKGAEKDVGAWFVQGKGVEERLAGLAVEDGTGSQSKGTQHEPIREDLGAQEARYERKQPTLPRNDHAVLPGNDDVALYALGLQEVVDINSTTEALRPYSDPSVAKKWRDEMEAALPKGYRLVAEQQLIGLLLLIYAAPDVADEIKSVSTTSVGTGLMGYMGNKGAVTARFVIGDTTRIVFVNCHLAAGADKTALERRNWDASQIVQRTKFEPITDAMDLSQSTGEQIGEEDFAFWVGDLNYRLQTIPGDDVRRLLLLHTRDAYDLQRQSTQKIDHEIDIATRAAKRKRNTAASISSADSSSVISPRPSMDETSVDTQDSATTFDDSLNPDEDPASLQTTLSSLLPHDQLQQQMKQRKAFHDGWREGPITFLPTYKYDVGSVGIFDSSEKKRAPSWCDRILYRTRKDKVAHDTRVKEEEDAKKRDEEMRANGTDQAAEEDDILYDYDPDADGVNVNDDYDEFDAADDVANDGVQRTITREGAEDELRLEYYTAHQRVLSSDHKPLDAVFTFKYDSVVPDLKAKVHAEVAKELDKAENEGRPNVTVVVDQQNNKRIEATNESSQGFEGVDFGDVKWNAARMRSLTVANTSWVPATLNFIERPVEGGNAAGIAPDWLQVKINDTAFKSSARSTQAITLDPGETTAVELEIQISDVSVAKELNDGKRKLDDTLVLRVEGGRDHFIPVRATWLETSLGRAIDKLIRIPEGGIRKLQSQRPDGGSKSRDNSKHRSPPAPGSPSSPSLSARMAATTGGARQEGAEREEEADEGPVRFSAPRELFRLTEAIEELGTRVIAEWDMICSAAEAEGAPWVVHPGWPFDKECWTTSQPAAADPAAEAEWQNGLSEICDALDTDRPLLPTLPPEQPRMQNLYLLSNFLLIFLSSLPDGIVPETLWDPIETYLSTLEKTKPKPSEDDQRSAVQEILSQEPSHSISFILLVTLLEKLMLEIAGTNHVGGNKEPATPTSPITPSKLRRVTGTLVGAASKATAATVGGGAAATQREQMGGALARIFAGVVFRGGGGKKGGSGQQVLERRRVEVLELFLRREAMG